MHGHRHLRRLQRILGPVCPPAATSARHACVRPKAITPKRASERVQLPVAATRVSLMWLSINSPSSDPGLFLSCQPGRQPSPGHRGPPWTPPRAASLQLTDAGTRSLPRCERTSFQNAGYGHHSIQSWSWHCNPCPSAPH